MSLSVTDLIHPTAVISSEAEIAPDVQVGPYADYRGSSPDRTRLRDREPRLPEWPDVHGPRQHRRPWRGPGQEPAAQGLPGRGDLVANRQRERLSRACDGSSRDPAGDARDLDRRSNLFMVGAHVGHDVRVGSGCTLVNGALVAGHCILYDNCILSGHSAVQQRARIGRLAMLSGLGSTSKDIPPFVLQQGYNCVTGLNTVGLRRAGMSNEAITALREAFRILYKEGRSQNTALDRIEADLGTVPEVKEFITFIRETTLGINPARSGERQRRTF